MLELSRMVADSMTRNGCRTAIDHRRLLWSPWFRCDSGRACLAVTGAPGVFALAEEVTTLPVGPAAARMLAVFHIGEAKDLGADLTRLFKPGHPLHDRVAPGRCFARVAQVSDPEERHSVCNALRDWVARQAGTASGFAEPANAGNANRERANCREAADNNEDVNSNDVVSTKEATEQVTGDQPPNFGNPAA
jgi:hypothetical protein